MQLFNFTKLLSKIFIAQNACHSVGLEDNKS